MSQIFTMVREFSKKVHLFKSPVGHLSGVHGKEIVALLKMELKLWRLLPLQLWRALFMIIICVVAFLCLPGTFKFGSLYLLCCLYYLGRIYCCFWIRNDTKNYKTLGEIDSLSKLCEWRYIPTSLNTADKATKISNYELTDVCDWLHGPDFLRDNNCD